MATKNIIKLADAKQRITAQKRDVIISPPRKEIATVRIRGTAPYMQNAFPQKSVDIMVATQSAGQQAKKGRKREPKDFNAAYENATHKSRQGWCGIPASAFRNAMISACRTVGFKMTIAKMSVWVEADGFDACSGDGLVKITKGVRHEDRRPVRLPNGSTDIRVRPMWKEGWEATVRLSWDAEQFSASDVMNLFARAGMQVGVGEGRPDSRSSAGMGFGVFEITK